MRHSFAVTADTGLANALRRCLLSDLENWAPHKLTVNENTSCQTDEYIAHRVGLIPFRRTGNGDTLSVAKKGGVVLAGELVGCAFEPVFPEIPIMDLGEDAVLDVVVHFDRGRPSRHARYSTCAAVGMRQTDAHKYEISFELHDERLNARDVFLRAIEEMEKRVADCLVQMGNQPTPPPKSRCG